MATDVGPGALAGKADNGAGTTVVDITNPANGSDTLDTAEVYPNAAGVVGLKVGTFYGAGSSSVSNRGSATLGDLAGGAKRTVTGLSISVATDDYAGWYASDGGIRYYTGGVRWYKSGDYFGQSGISYSSIGGYDDSIYMYSTEPVVGGGMLVGASVLVGGKILCGQGVLIN